MIVLGPLAILRAVLAIVLFVRAVRSSKSKRRDEARRTIGWTGEERARWVAAGLITEEQASAISMFEETARTPSMEHSAVPAPSLPIAEPGPRMCRQSADRELATSVHQWWLRRPGISGRCSQARDSFSWSLETGST